MHYYERNYKAGRAVLTVAEFLVWALGLIGILVLFTGYELARSMGGDFVTSLYGASFGFIMVVVALIVLCQVQTGKATIDSAEMTRDMLGIQRMHYKHVAQATGNHELSSFISTFGTGGGDTDPVAEKFKPPPVVPQKTQKGDTDTYKFGTRQEPRL